MVQMLHPPLLDLCTSHPDPLASQVKCQSLVGWPERSRNVIITTLLPRSARKAPCHWNVSLLLIEPPPHCWSEYTKKLYENV